MSIRRSLLRGVASLALAVAVTGTGTLAPTASAAPLHDQNFGETARSVANKPKTEKNIPGIGEVPGLGSLPGLGSIPGPGSIPGAGEIPGIGSIPTGDGHDSGDIPIIGDVANQFSDKEPEEIVTGAIQFAGVAAETVVPLIVELAGK
jgi:hypothetical protein